MNIYMEEGYQSRRHYLECLSENMGISKETVFMTASILGSSEDFDGLITTLEDMGDDFE
jgi:hypothetical protein